MTWPEGFSACSTTFRRKLTTLLYRVLKQNGYPANFICNASPPPTQERADTSSHDEEQEEERGPLAVIPYVVRMSENIRCVCKSSFNRDEGP